MNTAKSDSKHNELFLIIKSGIVGALALTGTCIILIILANLIRVPWIAFLYAKFTTACSLQGLFVTTCGLGFILGLIVRRRFPIIHKGIIPIAVAAIPLIIGAWLLDAAVMRVSVPRSMKLSDCTNNVVNIHLIVPKGHGYRFDLNTSDVQLTPNGPINSTYRFSGRIRISSNTSIIADFPISSDTAWLTGSNFALTDPSGQNTNAFSLGRFIQSQKEYDIQITLDPLPPPSSSIWLYWRESRKDTTSRAGE